MVEMKIRDRIVEWDRAHPEPDPGELMQQDSELYEAILEFEATRRDSEEIRLWSELVKEYDRRMRDEMTVPAAGVLELGSSPRGRQDRILETNRLKRSFRRVSSLKIQD